tara:strand:+ start:307 stop:480 length:174 start_codon:yes stop_codon:yes gene_type:complete
MRERISRWLNSPKDRALEREVEGLTIRLQLAEAQLRALYDALDEGCTVILPPRRLWP